MVASMRHHAGGDPLRITLRHGCAPASGAPDALLADLCRRMDAA